MFHDAYRETQTFFSIIQTCILFPGADFFNLFIHSTIYYEFLLSARDRLDLTECRSEREKKETSTVSRILTWTTNWPYYLRWETKDRKQVWGRGDRDYDFRFEYDEFELPVGHISEDKN